VGATFGFNLADHARLALTLGTTIPIGSGGGDAPQSSGALRAMLSGTDWGGLRVRGSRTDALGRRVIFTSSGLMAGCSLTRGISALAEFAETRFLNRPAFLGADPSNRSDHYLIGGLAGDFGIGSARRLQPTLLYASAVDAPKNRRAFRLVELDLQVSF
jgi:hypothetical protein